MHNTIHSVDDHPGSVCGTFVLFLYTCQAPGKFNSDPELVIEE